MTEFIKTTEDKKVAPFVKLGAFEEDNYKAKELAKAKENEAKYQPIRLLPGDKIQGVITGFYDSSYGEVMYLKDVVLGKNGTTTPVVGNVKIGVSSPDLKFKIKTVKKKEVGDAVSIEYLGKHQSPKDATRTLHKVNVE